MDHIKILKDLNYRIETADKNDPERDNAIRLRDKLLQRYGLKLEDIADVRKRREFGQYTKDERMIVYQYFVKRLHTKLGEAPYMAGAYSYGKETATSKNRTFEINLTDEEYARHAPIVKNLLEMYANCVKKLEAQLREEAKKRRAAMRYTFFEKADLLLDESETTKPAKPAKPSFGLADALRAARDLDGLVFPENHLGEERKLLQ